MKHKLIALRDMQWPILQKRAYCSCGWVGSPWKYDGFVGRAAARAAKREWEAHVEGGNGN